MEVCHQTPSDAFDMSPLASVREIDQLLDQLEQLARSQTPKRKLLEAVVDRARYLLSARGVALFFRTSPQSWTSIIHSGAPLGPASAQLETARPSDRWIHQNRQTIAVPIRPEHWELGALVVELNEPQSAIDLEEIARLSEAFAEIVATGQTLELEAILNEKWLLLQSTIARLQTSQSLQQAAQPLVNDVALALNADRVSLLQRNTRRMPLVLAVSGVIQPATNAPVLQQLSTRACEALEHQKSVSSIGPTSQSDNSIDNLNSQGTGSTANAGLLQNYQIIPILTHDPRVAPRTAIAIEWNDYDRFLTGCTALSYLMPPLMSAWQQQARWLQIPGWLRGISPILGNANGSRLIGVPIQRFVRLAMVALLLIAVAFTLHLPVDLRIEAEGALQPAEQRIVFAGLDGVVTKLLVADGDHVQPGDPLLEMRSPALELQTQEVLGEMRANAEKKDSLRVAANQVASDDPSAIALQSRIASEIRELETQYETLKQKQSVLQAEAHKLRLHAPIAGTVVARQSERFLDARPVRRGDALLKVVALTGPWQLELLVPDRDIGYVRRQLFPNQERGSGQVNSAPELLRKLEFTLAARPGTRLYALTNWVSPSARNPNGDGLFVDVNASVDEQTARSGHMGAKVFAYFNCGKAPFWFVWSRPFIESVKRRLWF